MFGKPVTVSGELEDAAETQHSLLVLLQNRGEEINDPATSGPGGMDAVN